MPYYNTCAHCGATLDPGEKCSCQICTSCNTLYRAISGEHAPHTHCPRCKAEMQKEKTPTGWHQ